jgi:hypothetical protein
MGGSITASLYKTMPLQLLSFAPFGWLSLRVRSAVRAWWRGLDPDDATAYLSQSVDHVDLACRMRRWNETDRHGRTPLL